VDFRLAGEHCSLRPLAVADAPRAYELIHDRRAILDWLVWQGPRSLNELLDHYRHWRIESDLGASYHLAIALAADDRLCGSLSLRPREDGRSAELGYWVGVEHWGQGIGTEAVRLACRLAFHHLGHEVLCAEVFAGNERSMRLLESLGFSRSAASIPFECPDGRRVLEWEYALTREEHDARHADWRLTVERVVLG
jgi:RimJ/RimL family protein N-acetyltransferase